METRFSGPNITKELAMSCLAKWVLTIIVVHFIYSFDCSRYFSRTGDILNMCRK